MTDTLFQIHKYSSITDIQSVQAHDQRGQWRDYSLLDSEKSYEAAISEILAREYNSPRTIRRDAVRLVQVVFTPDKALLMQLSPQQQRAYFEDCCCWAAAQWGESRTVAAVVHMDDHTPHLHWPFVSLKTIFDQRYGKFVTTLNAKKAIGGPVAIQ